MIYPGPPLAECVKEKGRLGVSPERLADPRFVEATYQQLSTPLRRFIQVVIWQLGGLVTPELLGRLFERDVRFGEAAEALRRLGLLFSRGPLYVVAQEHWLPLLFSTATDQGGVLLPPEGAVEVCSPSLGPKVVNEFLRVLGMLHRQPARITQQAVLYRKDIERLETAVQPETFFERSARWQDFMAAFPSLPSWYLPWREYPFPLGLHLWALAVLGLVDDADGVLAAAEGWHKRCSAWQVEGVWQFLVELALGSLFDVHRSVTAFFDLLWSGRTIALDGLVRLHRRLGDRLPGAELSLAAWGFLLRALGRLGLLEVGDSAGGLVVRLQVHDMAPFSGRGPASAFPVERRIFVQPSGDVILPPNCEFTLQSWVELVADLVKVDQASVYRLTETSIARALDHGGTPETILEILEKAAPGGLPQPVRVDLDRWLHHHKRLQFWQVTVLECPSAEVAEELLASRALDAFVVGRLSPNHILVEDLSVPKVREVLTRRGYYVPSKVKAPGARRGVHVALPTLQPERHLLLLEEARQFRRQQQL